MEDSGVRPAGKLGRFRGLVGADFEGPAIGADVSVDERPLGENSGRPEVLFDGREACAVGGVRSSERCRG